MKIQLKEQQKIFFTSDIHYNHKNLCNGVSNWLNKDKTRPFKTLMQMNDTIVENINNVVSESDYLIINGDVAFGGFENVSIFLDRLICKQIILIFGNHDEHIIKNRENIQDKFLFCGHYLELTIEEPLVPNVKKNQNTFNLMHYPIVSWNKIGDGRIHLFGHVHFSKEDKLQQGKSMDIGLDGNEFHPYEMNEILRIMKNQPIKGNSMRDTRHEKIE